MAERVKPTVVGSIRTIERGFFEEKSGKFLPTYFHFKTDGIDDGVCYGWRCNYKTEKRESKLNFKHHVMVELELILKEKPREGDLISVSISIGNYSDTIQFSSKLPRKFLTTVHEQIICEATELKMKVQVFRDVNSEVLQKVSNTIAEENLKILLAHVEKCDVTVFCNGKKYYAHSVILRARSTVFSRMLDSVETTQKEKDDETLAETVRIEVDDVKSNIFELLFDFLNQGTVPMELDFEDLLNLLEAAHKYAIEGLITHCAQRISLGFTVDNIFEALKKADKFKVECLMEACEEFLHDYKYKFASSELYENLKESLTDDKRRYSFTKWLKVE